jgi:hypothetical protein
MIVTDGTKIASPGEGFSIMAMSDEHKAALAAGRRESRAIKAYLAAVSAPKRRGRPVTKETMQSRLNDLDEKIAASTDPLAKVGLIQRRMDTATDLAEIDDPTDIAGLEAGFVDHAAAYSQRKGISYGAWRESGVPAAVLKRAGIKRTRG